MGEVESDDAARWDAALDWLLRLAERPADPATDAALAAWLRADARNRAAFERACATWRLAGRVPARAVAVPEGRAWRRRAALVACGGGAVAAAAVALAPGIGRQHGADLSTGVGEIRHHRLEDGSTVTLDTRSAVGLGPRALDLLAGRLFVEVAPAEGPPFAVTADRVTATAQGTAFAVGRGTTAVDIAVARGRVVVAVAGMAPAEGPTLDRGWAARVDSATGAVVRRRVAPDNIGAWRSGRLVIDDQPVAEAVAELGRYHRALILLRDEALAAARLSGVFEIADPLRALAAMVAPHGGRVRRFTPLLLIADRA